MPSEKRLDVRLVVDTGKLPLGLTARYAEYLTRSDGLFTPFGPEGRAAQAAWLLIGLGV